MNNESSSSKLGLTIVPESTQLFVTDDITIPLVDSGIPHPHSHLAFGDVMSDVRLASWLQTERDFDDVFVSTSLSFSSPICVNTGIFK